MTFTNQTNRTSATGSGSTGQAIPFTFPISATSDLTVLKRVTATGVETTLVETTNYTVVITGTTGGTVTTVTTIETTEQIHVIRNTPFTQELDLEQGGDFSADNVETALDKNTKLNIENKDQLDNKTLHFPETDPSSLTTELPNAIDRADKNLTFDSSGNPTASVNVATGDVTFSTIGTNIAEAADAAAERVLLELDTTDAVEFAAITGTTGTLSGTLVVTGVATFGDSSQMATSAAPTADADIANKKYHDDNVFIERTGDPAAADFNTGTLTQDATWNDLDLSSIINDTDAKAVLLVVSITDEAAVSAVRFRKNGNSNIASVSALSTLTTNPMFADIIVPCDTSQVIEYNADAVAFQVLDVTVKGWWH